MQLSGIFIPERIKIDLEAEDKDEVLEEMVDLLVGSYHLDCREEILAALRLREQKMSTGIKRGIALPHCRIKDVVGVLGVLGISRRGIDYDSLDGEAVKILFMIVGAETDEGQYLRVLKKIAHCLEDPEFFAKALEALSPQQIFETIKKCEEVLDTQG